MKREIIILNSKDRKLILKDLQEQHGVENLPDVVYFCTEKREKVYIANRELFDLDHKDFRVNTFGMYFGTFMKDGFRLSLEGLHLIKDQLSKNILELDLDQYKAWLLGEDLEVENKDDENKYLILKYEDDFVGIGKLKGTNILNYLPKSRKLKKILVSQEEQEE